jgi:hypothetical protein
MARKGNTPPLWRCGKKAVLATVGKTAGSPSWHHGHLTACSLPWSFKSVVLTNLTPDCEHTTCMLALEIQPFLASNSPTSGIRLCSAMSAKATNIAARRRILWSTHHFIAIAGASVVRP